MSRLTELIDFYEWNVEDLARGWDMTTQHMEMGEIKEYREYCQRQEDTLNALKKLAHYGELKEQGRLIELPCKVGDTVYDISDILNGDESDIFEIDVKWITLEEDENGKLYFDIGGFDYYPEAFGDVVFLTEEEAYAQLSRIFQAMQDELEAEAEWVAMEVGAE